MSIFVRMIVVSCIASTCSILFYLLFSALSIFIPLEEKQVALMLLISFTISICLTLKYRLPNQRLATSRLIDIGIVLFIICMAGWIFKMFPFQSFYFITVGLSGVLSYGLVIVIMYVSGLLGAYEINKAIERKRKENEL